MSESFWATRQKHYVNQPAEISLETYAFCNAACSFCPYPTIERKGEKMPDRLIDKLIDEMSDFKRGFLFSPFKVNEPLLDKRLYDICRKVEAKTHAKLRIFTNGAPLTQKKIDQIASLERVHHLWVSLNSHIPEEYQELMQIPFEMTAKRLDNLHDQDFPHEVMLSCVGFPNEPFRRYCFDRWPKFDSVAIQKSAWLGYTDSQVDIVPDAPCARWFEMSIMANGVVSLCCMDGEGQFALGDVNEQTMLEIYNAPQWQQRRAELSSRREIEVCKTCTYGG